MEHRIVVLGAGTAGTLAANRLRRRLGDSAHIVVVDRDDRHVYQPGQLFIPFGMEEPEGIVRSRRKQLHREIKFRLGEVDRVETSANAVHLANGDVLGYAVLVVASGAALLPGETEGLAGPGSGERIFDFYSLEGASALCDALADFDSGRLVVAVIDLPIKCPPAPLEFSFLADWFLRERGVRDQVQITFVTPLDGAFTRPVASARLAGMLEDKRIALETEFATGHVDDRAGRLISWDERELAFDLLVATPVHGGAEFVSRSPGLGDALGFVQTDPHTLQSKAAENVFALGDATNLPTSKTGSGTHFQGETLVENIARYLDGDPLEGSYDGHVNCFIESGFHKALFIDFNYEVEPLPGHYPEPHVGPLPLLKESRINHLAKLASQPFYWHMLLPGHDVPGISAQLSLDGKDLAATAQGDSR